MKGAGAVTVTEALVWSGGTQSGEGQTIIANAADADIGAPDGAYYGVGLSLMRALNIAGSATLDNVNLYMGGQVYDSNINQWVYQEGSISVASGAQLELSTQTTIYNGNYQQASTLTNNGMIVKTGIGTAAISDDVTVQGSGTFNVSSGILSIHDIDTAGSAQIASGAQLELRGTATFNAASSIGGGGTLAVRSGTATLSGNIGVTGIEISGGTLVADTALTVTTLEQTGGTLTGSGDVTVTGALLWRSGTQAGDGDTILAQGASGLLGQETDPQSPSAMDYMSLQRQMTVQGEADLANTTLYLSGSQYDSVTQSYVYGQGTIDIAAGGSLELRNRS